MKKRISRFFLFFQGAALRVKLARAFDKNDTRRVYALSRKIDALQTALIKEASLPLLAPR